MAKHIEREYRIIVEPDFFRAEELIHGSLGRKERYCKKMISDINRHIDNLSKVYIDVQEHATCNFCGGEWDTLDNHSNDLDFLKGLPICCGKAQEEFYQEKSGG